MRAEVTYIEGDIAFNPEELANQYAEDPKLSGISSSRRLVLQLISPRQMQSALCHSSLWLYHVMISSLTGVTKSLSLLTTLLLVFEDKITGYGSSDRKVNYATRIGVYV